MGKEKEGDVRVALVFAVFFLCVTTGGIFLIIYVFAPSISKPWFPTAALFLIGAPWVFWLLTYLYTATKRCFATRASASASASDHQISRRPSTTSAASSEMPLANSV